MKKGRFKFIATVVILSALTLNLPIAFAESNVSAYITHRYNASLDGDVIASGHPLEWQGEWLIGMVNLPGNAYDVLNPVVTFRSDRSFIEFWPNDPTIFVPQPDIGVYSWNYNGVAVKPTQGLPSFAREAGDFYVEESRFSLSRSVEPELLSGDVTTQTITVSFRLAGPLPAGLNNLAIGIGSQVWAYGQHRLVETEVLSHSVAPGWGVINSGSGVQWWTDPSAVEIGKLYEFQAVLRSTKSDILMGSPIFKPLVVVDYETWQHQGRVSGTEVEVVYSATTSATFKADNAIEWNPSIAKDPRFFHLSQIVSDLTPPPPPFHVIVDADVDIKPEAVNFDAKGVLTAFIRLPEQYDVNDIDWATVTCQGAPAVRGVVEGDTLIVKFRREDLPYLGTGPEVELTVKGELKDGSVLKGSDTVKVPWSLTQGVLSSLSPDRGQ